MKVLILAVAFIALAVAEPPAPSSQYLPSNQYGPPRNGNGNGNGNGRNGNGQNGNGNGNGGRVPSTSYGVPSNSYGAPIQQQQQAPPQQQAPQQQYGPPQQQYGPPSTQYGVPNGNNGGPYAAAKTEEEGEPANYMFEYKVEDTEAGLDFGHEEKREGDVAQGKYFVLLPDGRRQTVEYTADKDGYKPKITYEQVSNGNNGGPYPAARNGNGNGNGGYQY